MTNYRFSEYCEINQFISWCDENIEDNAESQMTISDLVLIGRRV